MKLLLLIISLLSTISLESQKKDTPMTKLSTHEVATFAGGCFWCMEPPFEKLNGVIDVASGYMGGAGENPTYADYAKKGHVEVVQITYDPAKITFNELLDVLWHNINPIDGGGQFGDRGPQYRSAIFYHTEKQHKEAEASKAALDKSEKFKEPIATDIIKAGTFYPAEEYHQDYAKKHPIKYAWFSSGRKKILKQIWGEKKG